jgi:hypothetical protein
MAVPATSPEGIRDLQHACEVATFLIGGTWARTNLSEGQIAAVRMLIENAREQRKEES